MSGPTSLRWRRLRSAAFSAVATELAALGHIIGGGGRPDLAILLIGAATIGVIGTGRTVAQRRWSSIFSVMVVSQLAFHLLFMVDPHAAVGSMAAHPFIPDAGQMVGFHLIAAAAAAVLLATGDTAIFALFAALRRAAQILFAHAAAEHPLRVPSLAGAPFRRPGGALIWISPRRGPPLAQL